MKQDYLKKAAELALKSSCQRAKTGTILVKKGKILIKTYNRIFPENDFCKKKGCLRDKLKLGLGKEAEKCRSVHSEAAAVCSAAKKGISLKGAVAYITFQPCINCAKLLYSVGIKSVYFLDRHADQTGKVFLEKMGVKCERIRLAYDNPQLRLRVVKGQK